MRLYNIDFDTETSTETDDHLSDTDDDNLMSAAEVGVNMWNRLA